MLKNHCNAIMQTNTSIYPCIVCAYAKYFFTYMDTYIHTIPTYIHTINTYIHTFIHTYIRTYIHTYIYTYFLIYIYIYIYIYTYFFFLVSFENKKRAFPDFWKFPNLLEIYWMLVSLILNCNFSSVYCFFLIWFIKVFNAFGRFSLGILE